LQEGGFPRLPGGVEHPVELVADIAVELRTYQPFFGRQHIVHIRAAGAGGVEKMSAGFIHSSSVTEKSHLSECLFFQFLAFSAGKPH
jgi:hypothetical protein